ncbi:MAG: hypothetical protein GTO45_15160 [Candidatus Aminicenantes bacterium]|nr:hypothetical protein [Candidatus Aminicenantes bacterium]NIM80108.1 hypothetical protein [Candidatus Aminicenantes bacterium]NIN19446.1 hypothetical protein [Candidatus Aminicenantes bacterium]NIN43346.1 hypothetical protein [Candidatus Aminicenantes bacterium]NIN86090.1 hypothetical protein [Candidatus Aminicenantes bacterium]
MGRRKTSYAERINKAKVMSAGFKKYTERLAPRGGGEEFQLRLSTQRETAQGLDDEQESLKGQLKVKTEELETAMDDLGETMSEGKKMVKLEMPQPTWVEFGIDDIQ